MSSEFSVSTTIEDLPNARGDDEVTTQIKEKSTSEQAEETVQVPSEQVKEDPVTFDVVGQQPSPQRHGRTNGWNFMWDANQEKGLESGTAESQAQPPKPDQLAESPTNVQGPGRTPLAAFTSNAPEAKPEAQHSDVDYREQLQGRREREFDRREREIDRRERELERRERELERRQREFDQDKARWTADAHRSPHWQKAVDNLRNQLEQVFLAERKKAVERETELEARIMSQVHDILEKERQFYGLMRMSDKEVNDMVESSVGYLLRDDEEIADRVRFQSLIYLSQEKLASQASLQPPQGSDSLSLAWRLALGPSVVTEERYKKAVELLENKELEPVTKNLMENKKALEYAVEYTSHLRKEGAEVNEHTFALGRIPREDYMESARRQSKQNEAEYEALKALVDFICPEI